MLNAEVGAGVSSASRAQHMRAGSFFGAIQGKRKQCGAIFTDLRHAAPRRLPMHSHELAFFAVLLEGLYAERNGRRQPLANACSIRAPRLRKSALQPGSPTKATSRARSAELPA